MKQERSRSKVSETGGLKISVAMCTYNGQDFLLQQLNSFLRQSRQPDELVVCDDASTDDTVRIVQTFAAEVPFPVRIVRNPANLGSTRNFAQAMSLCTGDLIALSDQDDMWKPEKLATLVKVFEQDPQVTAAFSDGELIDAQSRPIGLSLWGSAGYSKGMQALVNQGRALAVLKKQYFLTGATLIFRSEMRGLFRDIPSSWVHDAWMSWKLAVHGKLVGVPLPLIDYRIHAGNQVGVITSSAARLLKHRTPAQVAKVFAKEMAQLGHLRDEITGNMPEWGSAAQEVLRVVDARTQYLQKRSALVTGSRAMRTVRAFVFWRQYSAYCKGWRSLLADLVL